MSDWIRDRLALLCINLAMKLTTWGFTHDDLVEARRTQKRWMGI